MTVAVSVVVYVVVIALLLSLFVLLVTAILTWKEHGLVEDPTPLMSTEEPPVDDRDVRGAVSFDNISLTIAYEGDVRMGREMFSEQIYIDDDLFTCRV